MRLVKESLSRNLRCLCSPKWSESKYVSPVKESIRMRHLMIERCFSNEQESDDQEQHKTYQCCEFEKYFLFLSFLFYVKIIKLFLLFVDLFTINRFVFFLIYAFFGVESFSIEISLDNFLYTLEFLTCDTITQ